MAEITHAGLLPDLRQATALEALIRLQLDDYASIRTSGLVLNLGSINGSLSDTARIPYMAGLNLAVQATANEQDCCVGEDINHSSVDITVVRACMVHALTDLAAITGGGPDLRDLAEKLVAEYEQYWMTLLAQTGSAAANTVGTSGVDMTVDDLQDAIFALQLESNPLGFAAMLHPQQVNDLQRSLRQETGALEHSMATKEMIDAKGPGYAGRYLGVDIFKSERVVNNGTDYQGFMWSAGGLGYKYGDVPASQFPQVIRAGQGWTVEFERKPECAYSVAALNVYLGMSILEQDRIVGIVTDFD